MDQPGNHILLRGNQPAAADRMRELLARTQLGSLEETVLTLAEALLRPHLTPQGVGLGGYRERYVPGVLGAGVRGKAGRG
jgi:hypothetical protein